MAAIAAQHTLRPNVGGRVAVVLPVILEMMRSRLIAAPACVLSRWAVRGPLALSGPARQ